MSARSWRLRGWVRIWGIRQRSRRCGAQEARQDRSRRCKVAAHAAVAGPIPESWIPPAHVLEIRSLGRLYCTLMDERRAWQQRIHAHLFHQGCPPIRALLSAAGRAALAHAELSATGRRYVDTALRRIDELSIEIAPLRTQLVNFAKRQPGCQALQGHYGIGWLCAAIIWAEIGDARRFGSSDQLVRFAGLDVTVYSSDDKRSPGTCPAGLAAAAVGGVRGGQVRGPPRLP
ncbi:transposase IS116/IS110/IS902 family protein [Mycobacterium xenopi 4042]|uniref:Transposase IS116/IS110/IS902 family protein n=1 Tax=Mycobacterium xenopi 4042 TaxID=1299334 RepID=X7ZWP5_MYCXE|nr:transposase IS116/IS110/IS902 family protein [Mycobacterium xenopi 4042]